MTAREIAHMLSSRVEGLDILYDEPMSAHCSFRIGGPAELFISPRDETAFTAALRTLGELGAPFRLIGRGTNLLVADGGVRGAVLRTFPALGGISADGTSLTAGAGETLAAAAVFAARRGLSGLEFAHGIPGSVGGAVFMNAGAYGGEIKDVLASVRVLDTDGEIREYPASELELSYRHSRFEDRGGAVLSARFELKKGDAEAIFAEMRSLHERRAASQPLDMPSAGSAFKRPKSGYAAAMIDEAGLRGLRVGGAEVSKKHAGFIVNAGGATCSDVLELMELVRGRVFAATGTMLEPEIRVFR